MDQLIDIDVENSNGEYNNPTRHICRRHSKMFSNQRKKSERAILKCGHVNIEKPKKFKYHVFPDVVAVFIEARWRCILIYCIFTYIFIWLFFAGMWYIILYLHGELEPDHLPHVNNATEWIPCVKEIYDFTSIFLFSIEIHTTIGYGARTITLVCPSAIFTMCIESIIGTITQSFLVGIVFAKLTSPKNRAHTLVFSKSAIVNQRDRHLCLSFRVGNTRKSRIISATVHAYLIRCVTGKELDEQIELKLSVDSGEDILYMFPMCAVHKIDENSPFYLLSAQDLLRANLEILVVFEGTIESTGQAVQAKSSYTTQEVLWGHRYVNMIVFNRHKKAFVVDYLRFNELTRINTPLCSANQLKLLYQ